MRKFLLFIVGILFIVPVSAYNVILHYNGLTETIPIDGNVSITLDGDWSESNDYYTYNNSYNYTDIYYTDGYGKSKTERVISDVYFNGDYRLFYTGNQYSLLTNINDCGLGTGFIVDYSGFVVSGDIVSNNLSGNMFKSFIDTGFEVIFSNIPSYIQYVVLIAILLLILRIFRRKKRI